MLREIEIDTAYRLLLGRAADPTGLKHYAKLAEDGLTLDDLRSSLTSSEEYRANVVSGDQVVVDMGHAKVVVDASEPEFGRHISQHGSWEPHIMALIRTHLRPGGTYVDIGANVGVMAFVAADTVGEAGRVIAFEPHPDNIRHFLAGVSINDYRNVTLHGFALSNDTSVFSLIGSSNGYLMPQRQSTFQTVAMCGDTVLADVPSIDMIKIDIEGHEPFALTGLEQTLRRHLPIVLCEFNPRCLREHVGCAPSVFADQLFALTDSIQVIEHDGASNVVSAPHELLDLWQDRNNHAVTTGFLPDGMVHFDLLFAVRS
jgi:FkbM family methyltransferase